MRRPPRRRPHTQRTLNISPACVSAPATVFSRLLRYRILSLRESQQIYSSVSNYRLSTKPSQTTTENLTQTTIVHCQNWNENPVLPICIVGTTSPPLQSFFDNLHFNVISQCLSVIWVAFVRNFKVEMWLYKVLHVISKSLLFLGKHFDKCVYVCVLGRHGKLTSKAKDMNFVCH